MCERLDLGTGSRLCRAVRTALGQPDGDLVVVIGEVIPGVSSAMVYHTPHD